MSAYFDRVDGTSFRATSHVQGAWNVEEQHIAPALGLIAHVIEEDHLARHGDDGMQLARVSYDILGVLPVDIVALSVRVLRPGRTIELVEATLSHNGRPAVIARAWWMSPTNTADIAGTAHTPMPARTEVDPWAPAKDWPGNFIASLQVHRHQAEPGRAQSWLSPMVQLVSNESVSPTARLLGIVDVANGMTVRVSPTAVTFPNLDLTAHLLRAPVGEWIGFDTTVSFGPSGVGVTHSVLHDELGPIGTSVQSLTVRPK